MTDIQIDLIPDGAAEMPVEARDSEVLADKLKNTDLSGVGTAPDWDSIERVISGGRERVKLRVRDATLTDYDEAALDAYADSIASINGVKKHPKGWHEAEPEVSA